MSIHVGDVVEVDSPEGDHYVVEVLVAREVPDAVIITGAVKQPRSERNKVVVTRVAA